jgi:NAD(P)-dependent dehydrogenase (short-subunit alcohol dehydrogenase family)
MKIEAGHVAVITGGASGIGFGLAQALVARGVNVVISDIRAEALDAAAISLDGVGRVLAVVTDVTDPRSVDELAVRTLEHFGRVDLVCNNAGVVCPGAPMWEQSLETWTRMIDIKLKGVIHGVRSFAPHLVEQGHGHILNTASSGGLAPLPDRTPYTGTMHAVVGLTETLDLELRAAAPRVGATVLCPGLVDTPLGQNSAALGAIELPRNMDPDAMQKMAAANGGILSALEVAGFALAAIEADRVHSAPGGGVYDRAAARVESLLADISLDRV